MIEDALRTKVLSDGTIAGLVGSRYEPGVLPQDPTYPSFVAVKVSDVDEGDLSGTADIVRARIQLTSWDTTYAGARALSELVRVLIDGTTGTWSGIKIGSARIENDADAFSDEPAIFGRRMDIMLLYHRQ